MECWTCFSKLGFHLWDLFLNPFQAQAAIFLKIDFIFLFSLSLIFCCCFVQVIFCLFLIRFELISLSCSASIFACTLLNWCSSEPKDLLFVACHSRKTQRVLFQYGVIFLMLFLCPFYFSPLQQPTHTLWSGWKFDCHNQLLTSSFVFFEFHFNSPLTT